MSDTQKLLAFLSQTSGVDKAFRLLIYSLLFASVPLEAAQPGSTLVKRIKAFTAPLSETRVVLRLFGLLPILAALKQSPPSSEKLLDKLAKWQAYSMLIVRFPVDFCYC